MSKEKNECVSHNDKVNPVADESVATSESVDRNSGSTHGSFSAIDSQTPEPYRTRIVEAIGVNGFKPICLDQDTTGQAIQTGDWMRELFQPIIDRYGLECGDVTRWSFKIHEWDFILATLHLEGKYFEGLPVHPFREKLMRENLKTNAPDHPATANQPATSKPETPLLGVHRFVMRFLRFMGLVRESEPPSFQGDQVKSVVQYPSHQPLEKTDAIPRYPEDYCFGYSRSEAQACSEMFDQEDWTVVP